MILIGERINGMFTDVKQAIADKDIDPGVHPRARDFGPVGIACGLGAKE